MYIYLQDLHSLGARKFVVFDIGPIGCLPGILNMVKPKTKCEEGLNGMVSIFNKKLAMKLNDLNSKLRGSTFVLGQTFDLTYELIRRPLQYGWAMLLLHFFLLDLFSIFACYSYENIITG